MAVNSIGSASPGGGLSACGNIGCESSGWAADGMFPSSEAGLGAESNGSPTKLGCLNKLWLGCCFTSVDVNDDSSVESKTPPLSYSALSSPVLSDFGNTFWLLLAPLSHSSDLWAFPHNFASGFVRV